MKKIIKFVVIDILRNKIVLVYTLFLLITSLSVFNLEDNTSKGLLSLLNLILFIVPLVSIIFSTIYIYNSSEFIELLVSQPLERKNIWLSLFFGLSGSMVLAFFIGAGIPILIYEASSTGIMMLIIGCIITIIFVAIAFLTTVNTRDKAKGIGTILILLRLDVSALMGYTGAVFKDFFGTNIGLIVAFSTMMLWCIIPIVFSVIKFKKKDL